MTIPERVAEILSQPPWCHGPSPEVTDQAARILVAAEQREAA